jgi:hypothetical protein
MVVTYSEIMHDVLVYARDLLRVDATLCGSGILNITNGTVGSINHIFAGRPSNQRKGFENPRIICEEAIHNPQNTGDNPDGYHEDTVTFQITIFKDNCAFDKRYKDIERIRTLLDNVEFGLSTGGWGRFKILSQGGSLDPDKPETIRNYLIVETKITTGG